MYIHGVNITGLSVVDYNNAWRNLGSPETFKDALHQMQTLQKAGAKIAGFSFVFWRDDRRRKTKGPETSHFKGAIDQVIRALMHGLELEQQQNQNKRAA